MSVGDSAEELILIHAVGRERLLVLSCGLCQIRSKLHVCPLGDDREFCLCFPHTSRLMYS